MAKQQATHGGARKGSGRKTNAEKGLEVRSRSIAVKVTQAEYDQLAAKAERDGDEVSSWVRNVALAAH